MLYSQLQKLKNLSIKARVQIIRLCTKGGCFAGSALSIVDLILFLYECVLNKNLLQRDYLFLSKGHAVPALYSVLSVTGRMDESWIDYHLEPDSLIYLHPNKDISSVDFHSGSLGHLPSVAAGVALDMKLTKKDGSVFVIVGDGELNEGSIWETLLFISSYNLNNMTIIVDRNRIQANMPTESLIMLEPLKKKFEAFGFAVLETDGHDFDYISQTFDNLSLNRHKKPSVIIAHTIRGKGISAFEHRLDKWFVKLNKEDAQSLIDDLMISNFQNSCFAPTKTRNDIRRTSI